ncbi:uncharacterized protein LOC131620959 isoform X3 [Vicia villosa]|uniref:uncharacterized protein LOC131620959 isoform X3 n=1 Tax=Vicia villosa TaxID=3911 RepID=UPI00273C9C8B|nr:uncharacterized protein LOC131620959 isoform X3 [Vicia villosa]
MNCLRLSIRILSFPVKDTNSGKVKVIYDANEVISWLKAPIAKETEAVWQTESAVIWDRGIPLSVQRNVPCFDYCALARRSTCFIQGLASFSNWSSEYSFLNISYICEDDNL